MFDLCLSMATDNNLVHSLFVLSQVMLCFSQAKDCDDIRAYVQLCDRCLYFTVSHFLDYQDVSDCIDISILLVALIVLWFRA